MKKKIKKRIAIALTFVLCGCLLGISFFAKNKNNFAAKSDEKEITNEQHKISFKKVNFGNNDNNAEAYFLPIKNNNDIIYVKYIFKNAGVFHNEISKHGISSIVADILFKRIGGLFPKETFEKLSDLGVRNLTTSSHQDDFEISFYVDAKKVKEALSFFNLAFTAPNFSEGDLEFCKESVPTVLNPETTSPNLLMVRKLFEMLYENSNYGLNPAGTSQAIAGITADDVKNFIKEKLTKNNLKIFFVGDISETNVKDYFETACKNIPAGSVNASTKISDSNISKESQIKIQKENMNDIVGIAVGSRIDVLSKKERAALKIASKLIFDDRYSDFKEGLKLDAKIACDFYTRYVRRSLSNAFLLIAYVNKKDFDHCRKYLNAKIENYKRLEYWQKQSAKFLQIRNHFMNNTMKIEFLNIADIDEQMEEIYLPFDQVTLEDAANIIKKVFAADTTRIVICRDNITAQD